MSDRRDRIRKNLRAAGVPEPYFAAVERARESGDAYRSRVMRRVRALVARDPGAIGEDLARELRHQAHLYHTASEANRANAEARLYAAAVLLAVELTKERG